MFARWKRHGRSAILRFGYRELKNFPQKIVLSTPACQKRAAKRALPDATAIFGVCKRSLIIDSKSVVREASVRNNLSRFNSARRRQSCIMASVSCASVRAVYQGRTRWSAPFVLEFVLDRANLSQGGEIGRRARLRIAKSLISQDALSLLVSVVSLTLAV